MRATVLQVPVPKSMRGSRKKYGSCWLQNGPYKIETPPYTCCVEPFLFVHIATIHEETIAIYPLPEYCGAAVLEGGSQTCPFCGITGIITTFFFFFIITTFFFFFYPPADW